MHTWKKPVIPIKGSSLIDHLQVPGIPTWQTLRQKITWKKIFKTARPCYQPIGRTSECNFQAFAVMTEKKRWNIDTGATDHMISNSSTPEGMNCHQSKPVFTADESPIDVKELVKLVFWGN